MLSSARGGVARCYVTHKTPTSKHVVVGAISLGRATLVLLTYRRETTRRKLAEDSAKIEFLRSEKERIQATRGQLYSET